VAAIALTDQPAGVWQTARLSQLAPLGLWDCGFCNWRGLSLCQMLVLAAVTLPVGRFRWDCCWPWCLVECGEFQRLLALPWHWFPLAVVTADFF